MSTPPAATPPAAPSAAPPSLGVRAVLALALRPSLWWTALRVALRLAPSGWWRRPPFLPLPSPQYLRFRMVTAYGGDGSSPARPDDLVAYLEWCRAWPAVTHRS